MTDPAIEIDMLGGNCPVQGEGTIGKEPWYFRARGQHWTLGIGGEPILSPRVSFEGEYGDTPYSAGWMPKYVALEIIADCFRRFIEGEAE